MSVKKNERKRTWLERDQSSNSVVSADVELSQR